jgi:hypothetical protein
MQSHAAPNRIRGLVKNLKVIIVGHKIAHEISFTCDFHVKGRFHGHFLRSLSNQQCAKTQMDPFFHPQWRGFVPCRSSGGPNFFRPKM